MRWILFKLWEGGVFLPLLDLSLSFVSQGTWKIRILMSFDKNFSQMENDYTKRHVRRRPTRKDIRIPNTLGCGEKKG